MRGGGKSHPLERPRKKSESQGERASERQISWALGAGAHVELSWLKLQKNVELELSQV